MPNSPTPELSVLIPILNEVEGLAALFAMLGRQKGILFEVILVDGGSVDGSCELARQLAQGAPFYCLIASAGKGRARQMNAGADLARSETILFLHADSTFADPMALRKGLDGLAAAIDCRGDETVAGRFALRFRRRERAFSLAYAFYESKARLDRPGCTHGDQGFLMRRTFFQGVGPFDESLPLLEDTRLAEAVRHRGEWLLLPAEIGTSVRRFETEGLRERQTLNALIMNFAHIDWHPFFREIPALYRSQDRAGRLHLAPFFHRIGKLLSSLPLRQRIALWYRTGCYVRANAWQLAFALDVRRNCRRALHISKGKTPFLDAFDRWCEPFIDHFPGRMSAAVLVWLWFHLTRFSLLAGGYREAPAESAPSAFPEREKEQR